LAASPEFRTAFDRARRLREAGRLQEAETAYRELAAAGEERPAVLEALADMYLENGLARPALETLSALTREAPDNLYYHSRLAWTLDAVGRTETAIEYFERLIEAQPDAADLHFNVALLYRKLKRYEDAVAAYRQALEKEIDRPQEVWSNLGVLSADRRRPQEARSHYEEALSIDPGYVPALFNLAGLEEEAGDREAAMALYERILELDPRHWESLARIAYATRAGNADDPVFARLHRGLESATDDAEGREALLFALGKLQDDIGDYERAFESYREGNEIARRQSPPYDRNAAENAAGSLIATFDADWLRRVETDREETPVFICGMFRSGSSLIEQILAGHSAVTGGSELDLLPWLVQRQFAPYPDRLASASREDVDRAAGEYLGRLEELFPGAGLVTDKRPDNFLYLHLVRAMFPGARIVYTHRAPRDVCVSIYFQRLGANLGYATDPADIAHYYRQHERLMRHWQGLFGENIHTVDYDALVADPEPVVREVVAFLGLDWDPAILDFTDTEHHVKTASVWQVREGLHAGSSGRWRHYERYLGPALEMLEDGGER
jgi:tetratricopeptide (TPR) repeat protein